MVKLLNRLNKERNISINIIARDLSLNEEDTTKKLNTLHKLSNEQIAMVLKISSDEENFSNLLDIIKNLNGHYKSSKMMECILCFNDKLLLAIKQLVCNPVFLNSKYNVNILNDLCSITVDDEQLLNIILKLNEIFELLKDNIDNPAINVEGYIGLIEELIKNNKMILMCISEVENQVYCELNGIDFFKVYAFKKNKKGER